MDSVSLALTGAVLVTITAFLLLLAQDWRWSIGMLSAQYLGAFLLVASHLSLTTAFVKLIAGWIAGAVLGMAIVSTPKLRDSLQSSATQLFQIRSAGRPWTRIANFTFYTFAALLVTLAVASRSSSLADLIPGLDPATAWGSMILIGLGLLKLGLSAQTLHAIISLLITLSGFEILYAQIQSSVLVAGFLAGINLALAMAGAYLLLAPELEEEA